MKGCTVSGHNDHRIVMALAVAGMNIEGETLIETAEAMNVTFPAFPQLVKECGGNIAIITEESEGGR
jgi:3-phosphoshikimate 1-carboxyvinyltransferase